MATPKRRPWRTLLAVFGIYALLAGSSLVVVNRSVGEISDLRMMAMFELAVHSSLLRGEADLYLDALSRPATDSKRLNARVATRVANITGLLSRVEETGILTPEIMTRVSRLRADLALLRAAGGMADPTVGERFRTEIVSTVKDLQHAAELTITGQTKALNTFSAWTIWLSAALAGFGLLVVMLVADLRAKNSRLLKLSNQDALTGLSSRRHAQQRGTAMAEAARHEATPLTLAVIDIDHFKSVNDTHGHLVGDEVIRTVAAMLGEMAGHNAVSARMGGEEFLIVMPRTGTATAVAVCEKLQAALAERPLGTLPRVTISVGVATGLGHSADFARLYQLADQALYDAKRRGRDRIAIHSETDTIHTLARHRRNPPHAAQAAQA